MSEWFKVHAWKACIGESLSGVRIPLFPKSVRVQHGLNHFKAISEKIATEGDLKHRERMPGGMKSAQEVHVSDRRRLEVKNTDVFLRKANPLFPKFSPCAART